VEVTNLAVPGLTEYELYDQRDDPGELVNLASDPAYAAIYRAQMVDAVPAGPEATAVARESLAGAVAAAGQLPAAVRADLLDPAREAFTAGLNVAAGVGTVLFVAAAVLAASTLRRVPSSGQEELENPEGESGHNDVVPAHAASAPSN